MSTGMDNLQLTDIELLAPGVYAMLIFFYETDFWLRAYIMTLGA
jgi:hypothetical protein